MKNVKIFAQTIEAEAKKQIEKMAASEAYRDCQIRIMPDCHAGKGCTIGTVTHMVLVALCQEPRQRKRSVWTNTARRCRAYTLHPSVSLQSTSRQWRTSLPMYLRKTGKL